MPKLHKSNIIAFVGTRDQAKARTFYQKTLGLELMAEDGFALTFDAAGTMLRVTTVDKVRAAPYTVLGWEVDDIVKTIDALTSDGVVFERFAGMSQDARGVWNAPSGAKVAWFKDPDGNVLSISEF